MGKVSVRKCDRCERWDSADQAVKRVSVCGVRKDLCAACRISLLIDVGLTPPDAISYVMTQDGYAADVDPDQLTFEVVDGIPDVGQDAPNEPIPLVPAGAP